MKVMIVVTHLLGTGHLTRAATLGRAFEGAGHSVSLMTGGLPVPKIDTGTMRVVQLPPLHSDGIDFATLLDDQHRPASAELHAERQRMLVETLKKDAPDLLITELFPFGRRSLRQEFLKLLDAARGLKRPPLVAASIRDILAPPSRPEKAHATDKLVRDYYDCVLVHSDPDITPLDVSWPVTPMLRERLHYTGFVASDWATPDAGRDGTCEIVVSAGGGAVGMPIFSASLAAAALDQTLRWRLLVGGHAAEETCAALARAAPDTAIVEQVRPDFRNLLHRAAVSVSMCGYNTALDLLQAGTPAVLIPFDDGHEVEQSLRAAALGRLEGIEVLASSDLSAEALLRAVSTVRNAPRRIPETGRFDGAAETVRHMAAMRAARQ